jgi:hypothetical protein
VNIPLCNDFLSLNTTFITPHGRTGRGSGRRISASGLSHGRHTLVDHHPIGIGARWPVSRVLYPRGRGRWPFIWDARYRTPRATDPDGGAEKPPAGFKPACRPYLVLLPVGFTMPAPLPGPRCALTAPFHPYRRSAPAVCFLWHFPWGRPRRALPGTVFPWSPDFPPPLRRAPCEGGHPAT